MRPVCFDDCVGWLHEPTPETARGRAFIVASPHGFEELCARRTLRMLADRLAGAGLPTLRFDWSGAADSLGDPDDPAQLDRWRRNLDAALATLRDATGAREIGVFGLRFGALMAAELGARGHDLARVALLAPPPSGRGYVRELRALARVMATPHEAATDDGLSVAGFPTSAETLEAMRGWCFSDLAAAPAREVLICAPEGALGARIAARRLATLGARVVHADFPGYERMMCDPTASQAALDALAPLVDWASAGAPAAAPASPACVAATTVAGPGFVEEPLRFGSDGRFGGVWCAPMTPSRAAPIVFLNAGGSHRSGWARMSVDQARHLARRGVASLRIDLPGVGDSLGFDDYARPAYYADTQVEACLSALDVVEAKGFAQARLFGACSGGHHAFHTARLDPRVVGAMIVNIQLFVWTSRCALTFGAWMNSRAFDVEMRTRVADAETTALSRLQARLAAAAVALAKTSAKTALRAMRGAASRETHGEEGAAALARAALEEMSSRGVEIAFVFGEGDSGLSTFADAFGPGGAAALALPGVTLDYLPDTDHPVTPAAARARLTALLADWSLRADAAQAPAKPARSA